MNLLLLKIVKEKHSSDSIVSTSHSPNQKMSPAPPCLNHYEPMMPRNGLETARTPYEYGKDMVFTHTNIEYDTVRMSFIFKYPGIIVINNHKSKFGGTNTQFPANRQQRNECNNQCSNLKNRLQLLPWSSSNCFTLLSCSMCTHNIGR